MSKRRKRNRSLKKKKTKEILNGKEMNDLLSMVVINDKKIKVL